MIDDSSSSKKVDSKTQVYQHLHGVGTTMSIRILPEIKDAFESHE